MLQTEFALMYNLIKAKALSFGKYRELCTCTGARQSSDGSFSLKTAYTPCPNFKSVNCGEKRGLCTCKYGSGDNMLSTSDKMIPFTASKMSNKQPPGIQIQSEETTFIPAVATVLRATRTKF
jgi:hypothetical protein